MFKSAVRRALEHDAVALEITRRSMNSSFSAAVHENDVPVCKLYERSPQMKSEEVSKPTAENINTPEPATASGARLRSCAALVSVNGDVPAHAALPENGWGPAGH